MTNLLMGILVLFSSADGKLVDRTARETAACLDRLYPSASRCIVDGSPGDAKVCIVLGKACESVAPNLPPLASDELQVLVRQAPGRQEVLLRGGSPFATRAAALRFLEQCGVLFGPLQDFLPDRKAAPQFEPMDIREHPRRRLFGPHYWLNFPMDPSSFTREEWLRLVLGWSRMRATVMGYHFYQNFPWYDVEMRGFKDQSGYFFYSQRHPLAPEQELRYAVHNRRTYVAPDVEAFAENIPEMHRSAQDTLRQAMALAHELGLKNSVTFEPFGYGVPQPYLAKMKEWNGGTPVDPKDRLHPLMREYVLSAIRSTLQTYPDLDILKLVSGEGAQYPGTPAELRDHIRKLVGGEPTDAQGRPIQLPEGEALSILADTLTSCKLASEAVAEARKAGALRDGLELAIGSYPGSNLKVHPALFALIGRVVTDPAVRLHFLPAHGMGLSARAMALASTNTFNGRKLEISGWTEFDGNMYLPQSCVQAVDRMNRTLEPLPAEALYAIQWRVASTTFNNAYFTRSQWDRGLTPEKFWTSLRPLFGAEGAALMRQGMEKLETVKPIDFGFCYYGCWTPLLASERADKQPPNFGDPDQIARRTGPLKDAHQLTSEAGKLAANDDGRRLANYFANKLDCGEVHMNYWKEVAQAAIDGAGAADDSQARAAVVPHARRMLDYARQYLRTYQQYMLDRTDEGMLASYWVVAGQYAYRYAFPEQYKHTTQFYGGPPKARAKLTEQSSAAPVEAPH
jgi:hypothetical protein